MSRVEAWYSGRVQGVGFRYTVKRLATGFDVTGTVANLSDGRVHLIAEGEPSELEDFLNAVPEAGLGSLIRETEVQWTKPAGDLRGFEIIR